MLSCVIDGSERVHVDSVELISRQVHCVFSVPDFRPEIVGLATSVADLTAGYTCGSYGHSMVADSRGILWVHGGMMLDEESLSDRVREGRVAASLLSLLLLLFSVECSWNRSFAIRQLRVYVVDNVRAKKVHASCCYVFVVVDSPVDSPAVVVVQLLI